MLERGQPTRFDEDETARTFADAMDETPFPADAAEMVDELKPYVESWYEDWEVPELDPWNAYNSR